MKIEDFNRKYAPRNYRIEFRQSTNGNYIRLLDEAQNRQVKRFFFPDSTADLPAEVFETMKTLIDGDLPT